MFASSCQAEASDEYWLKYLRRESMDFGEINARCVLVQSSDRGLELSFRLQDTNLARSEPSIRWLRPWTIPCASVLTGLQRSIPKVVRSSQLQPRSRPSLHSKPSSASARCGNDEDFDLHPNQAHHSCGIWELETESKHSE